MGLKVTTTPGASPEPGADAFNPLHGIPADAPGVYLRPIPALTVAVTVYVDSVAGVDTNNGASRAEAFKTLARAWQERKQYGVLRAQFTIQLLGVGPYVMPVMADSAVDVSTGLFVLRGDTAAEVIFASRTATGDMAGFAIPTTAGVGATNTRKHDYIRMTSGLCAGCVFLIVANTDTSVSVANRTGRDTSGAIANGDTFQIIRPGTVVNTPAAASGQFAPGLYNVEGGGVLPFNQEPGHWFYDLEFTGQVRVSNSCAQFVQCRFANLFTYDAPRLRFGVLGNASRLGVGTNTASNRLYGAGSAFTSGFTTFNNRAMVWGVMSWAGGMNVGSSTGGATGFVWAGGVADSATTFLYPGTLLGFSAGNVIANATINLETGAVATIGAPLVFAVTSGSCWRVKVGAILHVVAAMTGGTSDAAGYGVDVRGGGRAYYIGVSPTLTGGTAGSDLRTTATAVAANAVLTATPSTVDSLGSPYGEVLARVA